MHVDPNVTILVKLGALPSRTSSGDFLPGLLRLGLRLRTYAAYLTASPQKRIGMPLLKIMPLAILSIVRCKRSALPLEAGLFGSIS